MAAMPESWLCLPMLHKWLFLLLSFGTWCAADGELMGQAEL